MILKQLTDRVNYQSTGPRRVYNSYLTVSILDVDAIGMAFIITEC